MATVISARGNAFENDTFCTLFFKRNTAWKVAFLFGKNGDRLPEPFDKMYMTRGQGQ